MKNKRTIFIAAATFILTGIAVLGLFRYLPQKVDAFNPQPDPPGFGLLGITRGQTLRINVVNTHNPTSSETPPDPCRAVMTFRNLNGDVFRDSSGDPVRRVVVLKAGQSATLDLNADNYFTEAGQLRLQLRPDLRLQQPSGDGTTPPDPCIGSAEVFNSANGRTQFLITALPAVQRSVTAQ